MSIRLERFSTAARAMLLEFSARSPEFHRLSLPVINTARFLHFPTFCLDLYGTVTKTRGDAEYISRNCDLTPVVRQDNLSDRVSGSDSKVYSQNLTPFLHGWHQIGIGRISPEPLQKRSAGSFPTANHRYAESESRVHCFPWPSVPRPCDVWVHLAARPDKLICSTIWSWGIKR